MKNLVYLCISIVLFVGNARAQGTKSIFPSGDDVARVRVLVETIYLPDYKEKKFLVSGKRVSVKPDLRRDKILGATVIVEETREAYRLIYGEPDRITVSTQQQAQIPVFRTDVSRLRELLQKCLQHKQISETTSFTIKTSSNSPTPEQTKEITALCATILGANNKAMFSLFKHPVVVTREFNRDLTQVGYGVFFTQASAKYTCRNDGAVIETIHLSKIHNTGAVNANEAKNILQALRVGAKLDPEPKGETPPSTKDFVVEGLIPLSNLEMWLIRDYCHLEKTPSILDSVFRFRPFPY